MLHFSFKPLLIISYIWLLIFCEKLENSSKFYTQNKRDLLLFLKSGLQSITQTIFHNVLLVVFCGKIFKRGTAVHSLLSLKVIMT